MEEETINRMLYDLLIQKQRNERGGGEKKIHSNSPHKIAFRFVRFFWSDDFYCLGNLHYKLPVYQSFCSNTIVVKAAIHTKTFY